MKMRTRFRDLGVAIKRDNSMVYTVLFLRRLKIRRETIDGKAVNFLGVRHTEETFRKHRVLFEETILDSDAVVVEGKRDHALYGGIIKTAEKCGIPVYCFENSEGEPGERDKWIARICGLMGLALVSCGVKIFFEIIGKVWNVSCNIIANLEFEGVDKLFNIADGLAVASVFVGLCFCYEAVYRVCDGRIRDLVTSWNTLRLLARKEIEKLTIVYGGMHREGILSNLRDPKETEEKMNAAFRKGEVTEKDFHFPEEQKL